MSVRLQSLLSSLGVDSRRHCASLVAGGAVRVNGEIVREPGFRVENPETDVVEVDGRRVSPAPPRARRTILLNKPRGTLCTREEGRGTTVYDLLRGVRERVVSAGRLDRDSAGLLVLSDDGALVNRLTHPRFGHEKRYEVRASGPFGQETLDALQGPMELDGYRIRPVRVEYRRRLPDGPGGPRHELLFSLREGRNRQIRNMCEAVGLRVESLVRVAVNGLRLPADLRPGAWRDATPRELDLLARVPSGPLRPWSPGGRGASSG